MILNFLFKILVYVFTGIGSGSIDITSENPDTPPASENSSPLKLHHALVKKDSVAQTQTPIAIFKLINNLSTSPAKNTGSLKNAGKMARTANAHSLVGKI